MDELKLTEIMSIALYLRIFNGFGGSPAIREMTSKSTNISAVFSFNLKSLDILPSAK